MRKGTVVLITKPSCSFLRVSGRVQERIPVSLKEEELITAHRATGLLEQKQGGRESVAQHPNTNWVKSKERHLMELRFEGAYFSAFTGVGSKGLKEEDWSGGL